jgi:hypothetical protein
MDELLAFRERRKKKQQDNQHPHINRYKELVIPFSSDHRCHYWKGDKSILEVLKELGASDEIIGKYIDKASLN